MLGGLTQSTLAFAWGRDRALSLKALTFFEDGDLHSLTPAARQKLLGAATSVNLKELPFVTARPGINGQEEGS